MNTATQSSTRGRLVSAIAAAIAVAGCVEDEDTIPENIDERQVSTQSAVQISDAQSGEIDLTELMDADQFEVSGLDADVATAQIENGVLTLDVADVDRPQAIQLIVNDADMANDPVLVHLAIDNEDGQAVEARAEAWRDHRRELVQLRELTRAYHLYTDLAYARGDITSARQEELNSGWHGHRQNIGPLVGSVIDDIEASLRSYRNGGIGQSQLEGELDSAGQQYEEITQALVSRIEQVRGAHTEQGPLPLSQTQYDPHTGTVSTLVGNEQLGRVSQGEWVFDESVAHLSTVSNTTGLDFCEEDWY